MRTTLDIADDVLFAAKDVARIERKPLGQVISELARRAFAQRSALVESTGAGLPTAIQTGPLTVSERIATYGIHPLPARGALVSNEMIDRLREADGI